MIDRHYGHLAREHAIWLLDSLNTTVVDVRGRSVNAERSSHVQAGNRSTR